MNAEHFARPSQLSRDTGLFNDPRQSPASLQPVRVHRIPAGIPRSSPGHISQITTSITRQQQSDRALALAAKSLDALPPALCGVGLSVRDSGVENGSSSPFRHTILTPKSGVRTRLYIRQPAIRASRRGTNGRIVERHSCCSCPCDLQPGPCLLRIVNSGHTQWAPTTRTRHMAQRARRR